MSVTSTINPMQVVDDWAVTADGRVAVVRGQEYKIEWVDGKGAIAASNKIPFAWRRLDDSTKTAFIDSTKAAMETLRQQAVTRAQAGGAGNMPIAFGPGGAGGAMEMGAMGGMRIEINMRGGDGPRGAAPGASNGAPPTGGPTNIQIPPLNFVNPLGAARLRAAIHSGRGARRPRRQRVDPHVERVRWRFRVRHRQREG
jgi:hypothetical protein